ncbi:MAG: hypothetical protein CMO35_09430 [Verrucomicrobiaceae bacterium]|nr:hypothetical protein [Verrucomicrobiaceae bacterium]
MDIEKQGAFKVGHSEELKDFLGMRIFRYVDGEYRCATVDMCDYIQMIVKAYEELWPNTKVVPKYTAATDELRYETETVTPVNRVQKMIGMLLWLSRCARPDIAHAISRLGSRVSKWDDKCEAQLKHLVGYLLHTQDYRLVMRMHKDEKPEDIEAILHTDADLPSSGKAQTGWLLFLRGKLGSLLPVAWSSKRQPITADSTFASEIIAAHTGVREALTLGLLMHEYVTGAEAPLRLCVDNSSVLSNAKRGVNDTSGATAKALNLRMGLLKDLVTYGLISVEHVVSKENRSNLFTKCLGRLDIERERELAGIEAIKTGQPTSSGDNPQAGVARSSTTRRSERRSLRRARAACAALYGNPLPTPRQSNKVRSRPEPKPTRAMKKSMKALKRANVTLSQDANPEPVVVTPDQVEDAGHPSRGPRGSRIFRRSGPRSPPEESIAVVEEASLVGLSQAFYQGCSCPACWQ